MHSVCLGIDFSPQAGGKLNRLHFPSQRNSYYMNNMHKHMSSFQQVKNSKEVNGTVYVHEVKRMLKQLW